ncbi:M20 metallopeptidase family protein [Nesterenkonia muleiensis]|uniref:M20 metallopeptidase family protein n=1 Tax=Nesterenkonia muleiensis TaxID=2282648 RepID=UPI001EE3E4F4|nr:M20 family metallopeptidase [Nesterenkonia muleiensis]
MISGPFLARPDNPFPQRADHMLDELQQLRRRFHAIAEVGLDLPQTQRSVLQALEGLPLEITLGKRLSSVTAVLRGGRPGTTVLLRGDMDALPVAEATGLEYASPHGAMHACGHDLHMAGLIGAARLLCSVRDELPGTVVFMFQPGEEGHGGGELMIAEGVLEVTEEHPAAAYAVHVDSTTPFGHFITRPGPLMAGVNALDIRIIGTGGHAAAPHLAVDPVPVAAEVILAVQSFAARRLNPADAGVISIGKLSSDSAAGNVLAREVAMSTNMRHFSDEVGTLFTDELPRMIRALAEAHRCRAEITLIPSYPATVNDAAETEFLMDRLSALHGTQRVRRMPEPAMAAEDFSYVLQKVPGAMVFLGAKPPDLAEDDVAPMHSERVLFDDRVLAVQAASLANLAWSRLTLGTA